MRTAESLEVMQILLHQVNLLLARLALVFEKSLAGLLALCEITLGVQVLQDLEERFAADGADAVVCLFWLASEEADVCGRLAAFLFPALHLVKEL
jgi:hypothetical protein